MAENMRDWQRPQWLADYEDDLFTPEEIAIREGLTSAAVRARFKRLGIKPRTIAETRRLRLQREIDMVGSRLLEAFFAKRSIDGVAVELNISLDAVKLVLDEEVPEYYVLCRAPRSSVRRFSNAQLWASLQDAAAPGEILTKEAYETHVDLFPRDGNGRARPGHQVMMLRFGSWRAALAAAGLQANRHFGPAKEFDETDALNAVVSCWKALGPAPTVASYDIWQREVAVTGEKLPSASTVRKLTGSWNLMLIRCWQIVYDHPLDQTDEDYVLPPVLVTESGGLHEFVGSCYKYANEHLAMTEKSPFSTRDFDGLERASRMHAHIQNRLAVAAEELGYFPLSPVPTGPQFDLAFFAEKNCLVVIEVKSVVESNLDLQLRLAVGQILQYAFQLGAEVPRVCPAIATEMDPGEGWRAILSSLDIGLLTLGAIKEDLEQLTPSRL